MWRTFLKWFELFQPPFDSAHGLWPWASLRIPPHGSLEGATGSARGAPLSRGQKGSLFWAARLAHGYSLATAISVGLMLGMASVVQAQEAQAKEAFPDRFLIRGGWNYVFNADTIFGINSSGSVSASVDFSKLLGGERTDSLWRIDSLYRFNPRHSLGLNYYDVARTGDRILRQDITINDITYSAGAQVQSELDIQLYRLFYNYSFLHDDKAELGLSFGLYVAHIGVALSGNFTCTGGPNCTGGPLVAAGSASTLTVPLPSFGFLVNYNIMPRLQAQGRLEWFYLETATFQGAMTDFYVGLEYRVFKHFSLGAAFDRFNVDVDYAPEKENGWQVINNWSSVYLYGALYF